MTLDLTKRGVALVTESGAPISTLEIEFAWIEPTKGGLMGKFGGGGVDVDATAIYYTSTEPTGYVSPDNLQALSGSMRHHGNVKKGKGEGSGERITINLASIRTEDSDVEAFALVASCKKGNFDKVSEAVCRIYDAGSDASPNHLGNVRVPIEGAHTGVVIGTISRTPTGWTFSKADKVRGAARDWRGLGTLAKTELGY